MMGLRLFFVMLLAASAFPQDVSSRLSLFAAIQRGSAAEVERLLKNGASASAVDSDGTTALMAAILFGDARMAEILLEHGADPNQAGPAGTTALMWAVPAVDKVRLLLARGANVNARSETERTALLAAASYPRTSEVLRVLLDHGADLRAQDRAGANALAFAVRSSDIEVVRFLESRGLAAQTLTPAAQRAALTRNDLPTAQYLMSKPLTPSPELLMTAAVWQPASFVTQWIDLGVDVNASVAAQYARTALLAAVTSEAGSPETVELLLRRGADANASTTEGESPLDWAIYKGDRTKIQVLEKYGAKRGNGPRSEEIGISPRVETTDPRVSLSRSLTRLLEAASTFREKTPAGCISCHHNAMPALAAAVATRKGIDIDAARSRKNVDDIVTFFRANVPRMMLGDPAVGGEAVTAGYSQMALAAQGHQPDAATAAITHWLLARQMPDGRWLGNGVNRPPSEYSTISHTAIAAGGLNAYNFRTRKTQIDESLRRAQRWLIQAEPKSAEERAMRLMGLVWTNAPRDRISAAMKEIRDRQEAGGGWSQFGRTAADAYATGQSLYALHLAGMSSSDPAYKNGVRFLLETQDADGAWLVKTHAFPVQRYFESGFPFGRHQWISAAGTSWAILAIAQTLPDSPRR